MNRLGFHTNQSGRRFESMDEVFKFIDEYTAKRNDLSYGIENSRVTTNRYTENNRRCLYETMSFTSSTREKST